MYDATFALMIKQELLVVLNIIKPIASLSLQYL